MKRAAGLLLAVFLFAGAFVWGFATERFRIFPLGTIRRAAVILGLRGWSDALELRSPSPALAALTSVPYLSGAIDPNASAKGVLLDEAKDVAPGLNFFSTLGRGEAYLVDGAGKLRGRWTLEGLFSQGELKTGIDFGFTHLFPNGDVLAFVERRGVYKLDRSSRLLWKHSALSHHDAWVAGDGRIYALVHETRRLPEIDSRLPSLLDAIEILSPEGQRQRVISLYDALWASPYAFLLPKTAGLPLDTGADAVDVLHTNHVETFDGSQATRSPLFRRGNVLVCMKNLNAVAILDGETSAVLWLWGPTNLTLPHHPTIVEDGGVLLFDNGISRSRIVQVDPRTDGVTWRYAPPDEDFFSSIRGACQRLSNGNTLVTLSQTGYALEITPSGRTVWKFANPAVRPDGFRDGIYRMTRYPDSALPFLGPSGPGG